MSPACHGCYRVLEDPSSLYHPACAWKLFGVRWTPRLDLTPEDFPRFAQEMAGKMSISGVQPKILMDLGKRGKSLQPKTSQGSFIVKPQNGIFPNLPENEDLCMHLAAVYGIFVPSHGLLPTQDGSMAYLIRRFDRSMSGEPLAVEDFAQILETTNKYSLSHEKIAGAILGLCSNKYLELQRFFERLLFCFAIGNGDMHLKNYSLITDPEGTVALSPAYDLLASKLAIPDEEELAISLRGKRNKLKRGDFLAFAEEQGIPLKAAENSLKRLLSLHPEFLEWIDRSFLPGGKKDMLKKIMKERWASLGG